MQAQEAIFGPDGSLARHLPDFRYRAPQLEMAELVTEAIASGQHAAIEAGTGIGKTFAYLVPVLLAGKKAVISTGTRTLQDQLFERDLPALGAALGRPVDVAMLKGRANYLCWLRLERARDRRSRDRLLADRLAALNAWGRESLAGDLSEIEDLGDDYRLQVLVTSTADNCLGNRCDHFERCFVAQARRRALAAQVVIVNHHLLLADLALKDGGFGELLPEASVVIVDEAHLLPDIAQRFFGLSVSSRELERIGRDTEDEATLRALKPLAAEASQFVRTVGSLRPLAGSADGRIPWPAGPAAMRDRLTEMLGPLQTLEATLSANQDGAMLERCSERMTAARERLQAVVEAVPDDGLRWFDISDRNVVTHLTPFDVSDALGERIRNHGGTWVFASATLAVGDDFSHFADRLGVQVGISAVLPSPFDYPGNGRVFIPESLPAPSEPDHTRQFLSVVVPLIEAAGGGAFLLFTSFRALDFAAEFLRLPSQARALPGPLLVQGTQPRTQLLEHFRSAGNAVLLGAQSFWQGVDVRGSALRLVAIDKLPFAVPSDPVIQARVEAIRRQGQDPFRSFQLPQAVLALKQGAGRLIRDFDDRGIVVLGDPRLRTRPYGRKFLDSLPPMPVLETSRDACDFAIGLGTWAAGSGEAQSAEAAARVQAAGQ